MKKRNSNKIGAVVGITMAVLLFILIYAFSWICSCGIYWVLCYCFGWEFSWGIATGLWIVWCLLKSIFNVTIKHRD